MCYSINGVVLYLLIKRCMLVILKGKSRQIQIARKGFFFCIYDLSQKLELELPLRILKMKDELEKQRSCVLDEVVLFRKAVGCG